MPTKPITRSTQTKLSRALFPDPPRSFPARRAVRMGLRAAHIFFMAVLLGGHLFEQSRETLFPWMLATVASGMLILVTDMHASFAVLIEVRGLLVGVKLALLLSMSLFWEARLLLLGATLLVGVVGSHMSGTLRHRLLFWRGRVAVDRRKG